MAEQIEVKAEKLVQEILSDTEYELVNLEYVKERDWYLRIFIDKKNGVDLDDCQKVSHMLDEKLDTCGFLQNNYIMEVSSPGLDRPLKRERDFKREMGKKIDISTYAKIQGKKEFTGVLSNFSHEGVTIDDKLTIPHKQIASVHLHVDF